MKLDWMTIVALIVIVVAVGYLVMKRRQRSS
jgi:hypothetical protein